MGSVAEKGKEMCLLCVLGVLIANWLGRSVLLKEVRLGERSCNNARCPRWRLVGEVELMRACWAAKTHVHGMVIDVAETCDTRLK